MSIALLIEKNIKEDISKIKTNVPILEIEKGGFSKFKTYNVLLLLTKKILNRKNTNYKKVLLFTKKNHIKLIEVALDKSNNILQVRYTDCIEARNNDIPTIPSTLELEMQTNPFLRHDQKDIQECIMQKNDYLEDPNNMEIFKALREWKDNT